MKMGKLRFRPMPVARWIELDRAAPAPTFFARPAWALAIQRVHARLQAHPLACTLDDGTEAVVPLTRMQGRLAWTIYHGMPFDGYTCVMSARGLLKGVQASMVLSALLRDADEVMLNLWPLQELHVVGATIHTPAETSALHIGGTLEGAQAAIAPKSRRMAGQSQRKGATCGIETGPRAAGTYYGLLREAATERWGRSAPTISQRFLEEVLAQGADAAQVWIVRYEGEPISGGVALYGSAEVSLWTTATKPGFEILRPHNLLHASIMEHAGALGLKWYNLNSSSGLEGVLRFKKALGANYIPYEILGYRKPMYQAFQALRRGLRSKT
jgi:hypothetical protein